ncbi:carboxypeptidase-like regulatory domain-containing protein [Flavobacteriaceae bacterium KMM 6897]|nr:carboxypeptidase-like regulatory domain-containing protein [Flavobacteriaceae bacterium KMM 6897]
MKLLLLCFCLILVLQTKAQENTGSIISKLIDKELNDEPLPIANVLIKGSTKGTTSNFDGLYEINNLTSGTYTIGFSYLGYVTVEISEVHIDPGKVTNLNIPM